jgi:hypothetical protein
VANLSVTDLVRGSVIRVDRAGFRAKLYVVLRWAKMTEYYVVCARLVFAPDDTEFITPAEFLMHSDTFTDKFIGDLEQDGVTILLLPGKMVEVPDYLR